MLFVTVNTTAAASALKSSPEITSATLGCANATLTSAAASRRSMTRVLELLASRGGTALPANEAFIGLEVGPGAELREDRCPVPDVGSVAVNMLQAAFGSAAEFSSAGRAALQEGLELSAPQLQVRPLHSTKFCTTHWVAVLDIGA